QKRSTVLLVTPENQIEERPVKLGIETPTKVEVLSGIAENDLVVVSGRGVRPGERVEPKIVDLAAVTGGELMPRFAIRNPYFIVVVFLVLMDVGLTSIVRMPVDMFPVMNIPVVVVATFFSGMPPEQIETDIPSPFERFFTLGSGIEHIESR